MEPNNDNDGEDHHRKKIVFRLPKMDKHSLLHHCHACAHLGYLSAAAFHGGIYGYMAGGLVIIIVIGMFMGEGL